MISPKQLLIRIPNWLGDIVMATPVLEALHQHLPKTSITLMGLEPYQALFKSCPFIQEFIPLKNSKEIASNSSPQSIVQALQERTFDTALIITRTFRSALHIWRGQIPNTVGFNMDMRRLLLTHPVPHPKNYHSTHRVLTFQKLLKPFGIDSTSAKPKLYTSEEEKNRAKATLCQLGHHEGNQLIGINPGAAFGQAKCWLPENFVQLALQLQSPDRTIVFFGDKKGQPLVDHICKDLPKQGIINLAGKTTLEELVAHIDNCDAIISNDSGPMHVAAALKRPLVALFGSTSYVYTGPYKHGTVLSADVACAPCFLHECPLDFRCMKRLTVERVRQSVEAIL